MPEHPATARVRAWRAAHPEEYEAQKKRSAEAQRRKNATPEGRKAKQAGERRRYHANREHRRQQARERYAQSPEQQRARSRDYHYARRGRKYGLTAEEYLELVAKPCAVCGREGDTVVDHDHQTGKVRGPLCRQCNCALGLCGDDPEQLRQLAAYAEAG